jgi:putative tryptophan/tyrosine transport system substrate-binding protein
VNRRAFVTGLGAVLAAMPLGADAQQTGKISRVGVLAPGSANPGSLPTIVVEAFRQGLQDLGYVEQRNMTLDIRWDEARPERNEQLARDLVRLGVDVIVAGTTPSTFAARHATSTIPIVMAATGGDPLASVSWQASRGRAVM